VKHNAPSGANFAGRRDKTKHHQTAQGQRSLPPSVGATHRSRKRTYSKVIKRKQGVREYLILMSVTCPLPSWLNLLHDNGYLNDEQFNSLNKDIDRILKVLASIVKTMKEKIEAGKKK
jgi:hypothetical protein